MKRAMKDEGIGPRARKDRVIDMSSNGGEGKGRIVLCDPFPEMLLWLTTACEEAGESRRRLRKGRELNLPLQTTQAKLGIDIRGAFQLFREEVKSMTVGAINI